MGNEYLEIGKEEGKKYQAIYIIDGDEEWNKGFDDIEIAIKIAKEALEVEKVGCVEICEVKTQRDLFVYDLDAGKVRETDMRETVKVKEHTKFTYVREGEPFENEKVKAHVGNRIEIQSDVKRGNLREGMKGKIITITNSRKKGVLQDFSDWFYKVEIEGRNYWMMAGGTWEVITGYKVEIKMDKATGLGEYPDYEEARSRVVSILQKGKNGWNAKITGRGKFEFFERRGSGVLYKDGKIAKEELTPEVLGKLFG